MTTAQPRVLVFSERNVIARKWHALQYEFEDVAVDLGLGTVMAPAARQRGRRERALYRINRGDPSRVGSREVDVGELPVTQDYDLFTAFFSFPSDIPHIQRLKGWRARCEHAVAYIGELYGHERDANRGFLGLLRDFGFDRVYVFNDRIREFVAECVGCPVEHMGHGVDLSRFSPYPLAPPRVVDFYQYGRRSEVTHQAALDLAREDGRFYIYDTVFNVPLEDWRAHRTLVAETLKRTRFFFAYRPGDNLERAMGDDTLSSRYFEAIAGGAVLLGSRPRVPQFAEHFPWPDATIDIPFEATDLREIVAGLEADPVRLATARMHNIVGSLRTLDWSYRWERILEGVGLPPTDAMARRRAHFEALADEAEERESEAISRLG